MLGKTLALLAVLIVAGGSGRAGAPSALACSGLFGPDASRDRLAAAFGSGNVVLAEIGVGEGLTQKGTVIFPDDPSRRLEILWKRGSRNPSSVDTPAMLPGGVSRWSVAGVGLGSDLAAVEKANGRPFELLGFGWDYAGTVSDWKGGALDRPLAGCDILVRFSARQADADLLGDQTFSSADPRMRRTGPVVTQIGLRYD